MPRLEVPDDDDARARPAPPRREPSYIHFTPRRAMQSFDNLVALANHAERLRDARRIVWRDRGEPVVELHDLRGCLLHAGKGALRAGSLAFGIRAGVNLFLLLFRLKRLPRHLRFALVRHAVLGPDTWRFSAMLGCFVYLYKLILNALPLYLSPSPAPSPDPGASPQPGTPPGTAYHALQVPSSRRDGARLALSARTKALVVRKKTRRWHAVVAGAVAGAAAVLFEKRGRRVTIGQQMFVRGLQGSWNAFSDKRGITVPYGAVMVFSICCGQILYACLLRPDTMPRSYVNWIMQASMVPPDAFAMNRSLVRDGTFDPDIVARIVKKKTITPANRAYLAARIARATSLQPDFGPPLGPCEAIHYWRDACTHVPLERFAQVFRFMFPVYGALHVIPALLFKWAQVRKAPAGVLLRALRGTCRSSAFLGIFVVIYQTTLCLKINAHMALRPGMDRSALKRALAAALISKPSFWLPGFLSGLALLLEEPRRRAELTMYVLPKALESAWAVARGRGLVRGGGRAGEAALAGAGMGMVMAIYQNDPQHLSGLVRKIIYQFIGPN